MTAALFSPAELQLLLGYDVDTDRAGMVERVAWGRIAPILGNGPTRPDTVDETLFGLALQLGCLYYENPTLLRSTTTGSDSTSYDSERETSLLQEVATYAGGGGAPGASPLPRGSFPTAPTYPDPAVVRRGVS